MTPSPNLHENEQNNADGDVGSEKDITAPKKYPSSQVKSNLGENGAHKSQQRHPKSPPDRNGEMLGDIDRQVISFGIERVVIVNVGVAFCIVESIINVRYVEVASKNGKLNKEDDVVDEDGNDAHH